MDQTRMRLPNIQNCGIFTLEVVIILSLPLHRDETSLQERSDSIHPCSKVFISYNTSSVCSIHQLKYDHAELQASPIPWFILGGVGGGPRLFLFIATEAYKVIRPFFCLVPNFSFVNFRPSLTSLCLKNFIVDPM